jgi:pyruvate dehydrogenase E2 component (dihydrolipoamide acetyltransferase)
MANEFKIPELGENVTAGDVVRIMVSPGDAIEKDQPVLELETDKATIEVPSDVSGTVKELKVKQGDKVKVGQVVLTLEEGAGGGKTPKAEKADKASKDKDPDKDPGKDPGEDDDTSGKAEKPAKGKAAGGDESKPQPAGAPDEGGMSQAEPGKAQESGTPDTSGKRKAAEERDQGTVEDEAPEQSEGDKPAKKRGEVVDIQRGARSAPQAPAQHEASEGPAPAAAPSVRRMARELGVDIGRVSGTGPDGRISAEDVQAYVKGALSGGGGASAPQLPDFSKWGKVERKPMSNIRRKTAEHLSAAWTTIPHVTNHDKADISELEGLRKQYGPQAEKAGGKMTMTAIAVKIVAGAMQRFPQFNASADMARQEIVYKQSIHVGVAVDTERGLLVPVIRDAGQKGIVELSVELTKLSERARAGKLSLDEMQGGGMTITNLGGIGGTSFTPIVNWPEVAILGISRGAHEPVWSEDEDGEAGFEARLMLPLSLSYDHRVIDGADAARFLRWVCEAFEQPFVLAL